MKKKINIWSFVSSIVCMLLVALFSSSGPNTMMDTHPSTLVLVITLITFVLGIIGFAGIQDWKGFARSVTTVIVTLGLALFLSFILFIGNLLG